MNKNLIGNQKTFGIEYSILTVNPSPPLGYCLIWIEGNFLGGIEGEMYLTRVCRLLESIITMKNQLFIEESLYSLSDVELFNLMQKNEIDETGKYWFMDTEGFDLFYSYIYRQKDTFKFIWQLIPEAWEEFRSQDIPTQLFSAQVPICIYEEVVEEFKNVIMKLS
jgi:hypothetical protein